LQESDIGDFASTKSDQTFNKLDGMSLTEARKKARLRAAVKTKEPVEKMRSRVADTKTEADLKKSKLMKNK
ncbi:hypothetical protein Ancab_004664, partial [Ancistrocladus abbreviatus]